MIITKYLHSCVVVETNGMVFLLDPGQFTEDAHVLHPDNLSQLDYILITHEHSDHFSLPYLQAWVKRFPDVQIISTPTVVAILKEQQIYATTKPTETIAIDSAAHESIPFAPPPENVQFTIGGVFTHPGDSYHFSSQAEVLAMPMTAPWGYMVKSLEKLLELKPKIVVPIHDWHWKDEALAGMYPRVAEYLKPHGIDFMIPKTGEHMELGSL